MAPIAVLKKFKQISNKKQMVADIMDIPINLFWVII
jgi:hypothetical protein